VKTVVGVAQLVELWIVIPAVVGSNPIVHPTFFAKFDVIRFMGNIVLRASLDRVKLCGSGGIGRHAGFRFQCFTA
jgi:hypothetical protein